MGFAFSTVVALPFAGVKVEATGTEKMLYFTSFFVVEMESFNSGVSFTLKASEIVGVYGFTIFTTSGSSSFSCENIERLNNNIVAIENNTMRFFDIFIVISF